MANKHNRDVPRKGDNIRIPMTEEEALRLAFKVKPTKDMPRPGAKRKLGKSPIKRKAD